MDIIFSLGFSSLENELESMNMAFQAEGNIFMVREETRFWDLYENQRIILCPK